MSGLHPLFASPSPPPPSPPPRAHALPHAIPASASLTRCTILQPLPLPLPLRVGGGAGNLFGGWKCGYVQCMRWKGGAEESLSAVEAAAVRGLCDWKEQFVKTLQISLLVAALSFSGVGLAEARPQGVNRPELLPKVFTPLIDVAGFLSEGQETRIIKDLRRLEEDTGFKLRILAQNYPNTPGLAVRDFWQVDDSTIVFVADPTMGNILNFNVGAAVDLSVPRSFWSRLAGAYGNLFYWREKGEDSSIVAAVSAIDSCLREPPGPYACSDIK